MNIRTNIIWIWIVAGVLFTTNVTALEREGAQPYEHTAALATADPAQPAQGWTALTVKIAGSAPDPYYGYSPDEAIGTGASSAAQRAYLKQLRGTEGEPLEYRRTGACAGHGGLLIECYEVTHEGLGESVTLYLDLSRAAPLYAPLGFTFLE